MSDPTVYLEGFEALKAEGCLRADGISTNSLDVLKKFNVNGTCNVVQLDYSLLNRAPEAALLPTAEEHGIGVMVWVPGQGRAFRALHWRIHLHRHGGRAGTTKARPGRPI